MVSLNTLLIQNQRANIKINLRFRKKKYYICIVERSNQYAIRYVDKQRKQLLGQYKTVKDYDNAFVVSDEMMRDFIAMGEQDSVKYDEEKYRTSEQLLKAIIKGLIARDVYGDQSAYNIIINHRNHDLKAALELLNDRKRYERLLREGNPEYERLVKHKDKQ